MVDLKTASYFTSKMGTFDNSTRVAIWDIEAMANQGNLRDQRTGTLWRRGGS